MSIEFASKEDAIVYCERMGRQAFFYLIYILLIKFKIKGFKYEVHEPHLLNKRIKSYGANFSWNKKTRRACK